MPRKAIATEKDFENNIHRLKYKICISGAAETGHCAKDAFEKAEAIGRETALRGMVLMTGASTGIPYWAAKGAKLAGGFVIGFSPASSKTEHVKTYKLPTDYHDVIIYTGFDYSGRNLLLARSSDAIVTVCGRLGTLNEFTIGFEDGKPMGVLEGSGGTADCIRDLLEKSHRGSGHVAFAADPAQLLDKVIASVKDEEERSGATRQARM